MFFKLFEFGRPKKFLMFVELFEFSRQKYFKIFEVPIKHLLVISKTVKKCAQNIQKRDKKINGL